MSGNTSSYVNNATAFVDNPSDFKSLATKREKSWYQAKARYLKARCESSNPEQDKLKILFDAANGTIDEKDYSYVTNPFNSDNEKLKEFPAKLRNHNIITPIVYRYVGEYIKSRFKYAVGINNDDVETRRKREETDLVHKAIDIMLADVIKGTDANKKADGQAKPNLEEIIKEFNDNWADSRVVQGDDVLEYLNDRFDFDYVYWSAYVDWIVSGRFVTYKDVRFDDIYFEQVPVGEFYPVMNGTDYIEDLDEMMRVYSMSLSSIVAQFRDMLTPKDIKYLQELNDLESRNTIKISSDAAFYTNYHGDVYDVITDKYGSNGIEIPMANGLTQVRHYVWSSFKQIAILQYTDNLGKVQETEVPGDYKADIERNEIVVSKEYVPQYMEMYQFGDERLGVYTRPEPIPVQQNGVNNTGVVKNPYGGKLFLFNGLYNPSIVAPLLPYQVIYNVINYHREVSIANNIGKIMVIPKGILVDDDEISMSEAVYMIKADKKLYVNEQADGFATAIQSLKSVDANDAEYIVGLGKILAEIKEEAWEVVGMNRQRYGDTMASDGKATTEQAIYRASIGSAPITEIFNKARLKEYMGLINYAKFAWLEDSDSRGLGAYRNSDSRIKYLTINPKEFTETDYGLFVTNNTKEEEKLKAYKELAFSASQNGAFELAIEAIEEDNKVKIKNTLKAWRKIEDERKQGEQQAAQQAQQQVQQQATKLKELELNNFVNVAQLEAQGRVDVAEINAQSKLDVANMQQETKTQEGDVKLDAEQIKANTQREIAKINSMLASKV